MEIWVNPKESLSPFSFIIEIPGAEKGGGWGVWDPALWFWYSALSIALKEHIVSWPQPQPLYEKEYFFLFTDSCSSSPSLSSSSPLSPYSFSSPCKTICKQSGSRSLSWDPMDRELLRRCMGHYHLVTGRTWMVDKSQWLLLLPHPIEFEADFLSP